LQEINKKERNKNIRVRFAPAPTGKMHLGNVRTALENYLFAKKHNGISVLRIEDTDSDRNFDPGAKEIIATLNWLGLTFNEGPYFQSERTAIYQEKLLELEKKNLIYRCFCTTQELEEKKQRQIALKKPPRYDRTCRNLSQEKIQKNIAEKKPFIWRFKINPDESIDFKDIARGSLHFELTHFTDFPITRQNGSFTFIFANAIDDMSMNITYVLRGDDHLTNTVNQVAIYQAFGAAKPTFWHLPILCNKDGKKLSKRDFGFSLEDLKAAGYLPHALVNYLGIIGGSVKDEIMTLDELIQALPENPNSTSHIKYDVEKLNWVNHKWMEKLTPQDLVEATIPFLKQAYNLDGLSEEKLEQLLTLVHTDLVTLKDVIEAIKFYFEKPTVSEEINPEILKILQSHQNLLDKPEEFLAKVKEDARTQTIAPSALFQTIRLLLIGSKKGPNLVGLLKVLGKEKSLERIK
jgi:glutamyl-tRNA synthetase